MSTGGFKKQNYPKSRIATFDVGRISLGKHLITGFIEIDITDARKQIKEKCRDGESISLISWFIKSMAIAIKEFPAVHGLLNKRNELILFDDVDVALPVERNVNGTKVPLVMLINSVNSKTVNEIHAEIQKAKLQDINDESDYVLGGRKSKFLMNLFYSLPQKLRLIIWNALLRNPFKTKKNMGTVMVTAIGMMSGFPGWILPKSMHNLNFGLGSITKKPWVVKDEIEIREILHLTVQFNHDVVDGVPAARFVKKLVSYLEKAGGLYN
jgi:pyruvate/2-oxoglutarate dehydrogenase complex dihydrolipoamide acyltransferase (E2) component